MLRRLLLTAALSVCAAATALSVPPDIEQLRDQPGETASPAQSERAARPSATITTATAGEPQFGLCLERVVSFSPSAGGSDCWGWEAPDGTEYAIMGIYDGVAFVDANTGQVVDVVPGPTSLCGNVRWRDMSTYQNYCYAVSECTGTNQGISVIDMSTLPDSAHLVTVVQEGGSTSHNLAIDTAQGYLYVVTPNYDGVRVLDLSNPAAPVQIATVPVPDIHDMYARNDTIWVAEANNHTWSAWDASNKSSVAFIRRVTIPNSGYVHNIWPSGDGRHVVTTEETSGKTIKFWNVEDYNNVQLVGQYLAPANLAHNAHMIGDTAFLSHYESGTVVVDFSDPANPAELASYDTWPQSENSSYSGAWGTFPFTSSGRLYASNGNNQLFILNRNTVTTNDTYFGDTLEVFVGMPFKVDVVMSNAEPISRIQIPFDWSGPFDMTFDSISTKGLRTDYFDSKQFVAFDTGNNRAAYNLAVGNQMPLEAGSGPVLSLFFTVAQGIAGSPNPIQFVTVSGKDPLIEANCVEYMPVTQPAVLELGGCCNGLTGNIDQDVDDIRDLGDILYLANAVFLSGPALPCPEAANTDGDPGGIIDLSDVLTLASAIFLSGPPPAACQ